MLMISSTFFGEQWVRTTEGSTVLYISVQVFSCISQLIIIFIFYQISETVRRVYRQYQYEEIDDTEDATDSQSDLTAA